MSESIARTKAAGIGVCVPLLLLSYDNRFLTVFLFLSMTHRLAVPCMLVVNNGVNTMVAGLYVTTLRHTPPSPVLTICP